MFFSESSLCWTNFGNFKYTRFFGRYKQTHTHIHTYTYTNPYTHTHTHAQTHTHTHTLAQTHTHTHAQTQTIGVIGNWLSGIILQETNSWPLVFGVMIGVYILGCVSFLICAKGDVLFY